MITEASYSAAVEAQPRNRGRPQIYTPTRAHVPWNTNTKMCTSNYDRNTSAKNGCDHSTPLSPHGCAKMPIHFLPFLSFPFLFYFYSCSCVAPKRLDWFHRLMAQKTWMGARKCLLYVCTISDPYLGVKLYFIMAVSSIAKLPDANESGKSKMVTSNRETRIFQLMHKIATKFLYKRFCVPAI
jgi:hypothetical protein